MPDWPDEGVGDGGVIEKWSLPESNLILDFHGDPRTSDLVVISDGNHHMALGESLQLFRDRFPDVGDIFYATTPPSTLLTLLRKGRMKIGKFILSVQPHPFLSPPQVLDSLVADGHMAVHRPCMKSRGIALLVRKGNPKRIAGVLDLAEKDMRLFLSNPVTESGSHWGYAETMKTLVVKAGGDASFLETIASSPKTCFGHCIHHREAPEAVAAGVADAAVFYHHLALCYVRIFPQRFDMIPLEGTTDACGPEAGSGMGAIHAGLIGDGGP